MFYRIHLQKNGQDAYYYLSADSISDAVTKSQQLKPGWKVFCMSLDTGEESPEVICYNEPVINYEPLQS
jgi:hypothetical protein